MADVSVVVLGASGFVGARVLDLWAGDASLVAPTHAQLDVLDRKSLAAFLTASEAPLVLNLAAWADVDGAEAERGDAGGRVYALNAAYPKALAELCRELHKHLLHVSTDYVFDGTQSERAYREADAANPICWYAKTKYYGERLVLETNPGACIVRIAMPFSGADYSKKRDFARTCVARLSAEQPLAGVTDQKITPVFLDDAVAALRALLELRYSGVVHVAAADATTPYAFAHSIARRLGLNPDLITPETFDSFAEKRPARRPQHSWLDVSLFSQLVSANVLRPVEAQLDTWVDQLTAAGTLSAFSSRR